MDRESAQGEHMMISNSTFGSVDLTYCISRVREAYIRNLV